MALKVLVLRKRIEPLQAELEQLRTAASSFEAREAELEQAINEAATDEEREVVETLVSEFEQTRETNASEQARISGEIAELERQIAEIEAAGKAARSAEPGFPVQIYCNRSENNYDKANEDQHKHCSGFYFCPVAYQHASDPHVH